MQFVDYFEKNLFQDSSHWNGSSFFLILYSEHQDDIIFGKQHHKRHLIFYFSCFATLSSIFAIPFESQIFQLFLSSFRLYFNMKLWPEKVDRQPRRWRWGGIQMSKRRVKILKWVKRKMCQISVWMLKLLIPRHVMLVDGILYQLNSRWWYHFNDILSFNDDV